MLELNQEYYSRQGQFGGLHGLLTTGYTYLLEEAGAELRRTNENLYRHQLQDGVRILSGCFIIDLYKSLLPNFKLFAKIRI